MKAFGYAVAGAALLTGSALAQPALTPEQQASAPATGAFNDMLSAVHNNGQTAQHLSSLKASQVQVRDAYLLSMNGQPGELDQALAGNKDGVQELRQALTKNKPLNSELARAQVPMSNVVAADVHPGGRVVVYAYPQDRVPPTE